MEGGLIKGVIVWTELSRSRSGCGVDACGIGETCVIQGQGTREVGTKELRWMNEDRMGILCKQYAMRQVDGMRIETILNRCLCCGLAMALAEDDSEAPFLYS